MIFAKGDVEVVDVRDDGNGTALESFIQPEAIRTPAQWYWCKLAVLQQLAILIRLAGTACMRQVVSWTPAKPPTTPRSHLHLVFVTPRACAEVHSAFEAPVEPHSLVRFGAVNQPASFHTPSHVHARARVLQCTDEATQVGSAHDRERLHETV